MQNRGFMGFIDSFPTSRILLTISPNIAATLHGLENRKIVVIVVVVVARVREVHE